jgi:hypothetical protein
MGRIAKVDEKLTHESVFEKNAIDKKNNKIKGLDQTSIKTLTHMYELYGRAQDVEKINENLNTTCIWKEECSFDDEDASSYIKARNLLENNKSELSDADAAIIWLVQKSSKEEGYQKVSEQLANFLLNHSSDEEIEKLTNKINEEFTSLANDFSLQFKNECLNQLLKSNCANEAQLINQQMFNGIDLLVNDIQSSQILNMTMENQIKDDFKSGVVFKLAAKESLAVRKNTSEKSNLNVSKKTAEVSVKKVKTYSAKNNSKAIPIKIEIIDPRYSTEVSREFVLALEDEKAKLMKIYHLSNSEYDSLASYAFGILGNESEFGNGHLYQLKSEVIPPFGVAVLKEWKNNMYSKAKKDFEKGKEEGGLLQGIKEGATTYIKQGLDSDIKLIKGKVTSASNSSGPTQIKKVPVLIAKHYGLKKDDLAKPKNAAVATIGFLAASLEELRVRQLKNPAITDKNRMEYIHYIYMGSVSQIINKTATPDKNIYLRNLKKYQKGVKISQL